MKLRKLLIIAAVMTTMVLAGCGGSDNSSAEGESNAASGEAGFEFTTGDVTIKMNEEASGIIEKLGEASDYFEAESCAFKGLDKTYTYAGFKLYTYPTDEKDYVNDVEFMDDSVETAEGITIGSTVDEVKEAYGDDYEEKGQSMIYTKGDSTLTFVTDGASVTSVDYTAITGK